MDGSLHLRFSSLGNNNGKRSSITFNSTNLTCGNTYCHNPAGTGGTLSATNAGNAIFPSWTAASYLTSTTKTAANCNKCHKSPNGVSFAAPNYDHGNMPLSEKCSDCHGHEGDTGGEVGKRHIDGVLYGAGKCDNCHGYQPSSWATSPSIAAEGKGAHAKHVTYLTTLNGATLDPNVDKVGADTGATKSWTGVCQTCHNSATHMSSTTRQINFNNSVLQHGASAKTYDGTPGTSSAATPKTCSNLGCHYTKTPIWSTY